MSINVNFPQWFLEKSEVKRLRGGQFMLLVYLYGRAVYGTTDGYLPADVLEDMPRGVGSQDDLDALLERGLLLRSEKSGSAYYLAEYQATQSSAATIQAHLDRRRENDRKRQAEYREREKQRKAVQEQRDNFLPPEAETTGASYQPPGYNPNVVWDAATPGAGGSRY